VRRFTAQTGRNRVSAGRLRDPGRQWRGTGSAVGCPLCGAGPGEPCVRDDGRQGAHYDRRDLARQQRRVRDSTVTVRKVKPPEGNEGLDHERLPGPGLHKAADREKGTCPVLLPGVQEKGTTADRGRAENGTPADSAAA
jgi:hypothetical protein